MMRADFSGHYARLAGYIAIAIVAFAALRFWVGFYEDDEFGDKYLFLKHEPTWQFTFLPVLSSGAEDVDVNRLPPETRSVQERYMSFVVNRRADLYLGFPWLYDH